jgi:hypothetical protein
VGQIVSGYVSHFLILVNIFVNAPSDLMEFSKKAAVTRGHCEIKSVSVMKLNLDFKFIT